MGLFSNQERVVEQDRKKTKDKCKNKCPKPWFVHRGGGSVVSKGFAVQAAGPEFRLPGLR